jgi:hypothetical protein
MASLLSRGRSHRRSDECRMDPTSLGMDDPFIKNVSWFFTLYEDEPRSTTATNILTQHHAKRHVGREDQADGHGVKKGPLNSRLGQRVKVSNDNGLE